MKGFGVVPVHPAEGRELDVLDGLPRSLTGPADELGLVEPVHGLGERVVVTVANRTDRWDRAELGESFAVTDARELAAGIGVTPQSFELGAARPARHLERVEDHPRAHVRCDSPADDHPTERVDDETHV